MVSFDKGMAGVAVVVLSLIASALLGVVLNVDSVTVQRDTPIYQSDITGLYDASTQKSYIEYDVSANYNGYSWNDTSEFPMDFKESNTANNYPFSIYLTDPVTEGTTLDILGDDEITDIYYYIRAFYNHPSRTVSSQDDTYHIWMSLETGVTYDYGRSYYIGMDKLYDILYEQAIAGDLEDALTTVSFNSVGTVSLLSYSYSPPPPITNLSNSISSYITNMGVYVLPKTYLTPGTDTATISNQFYPYNYLSRVGNNGEIKYTFTYTKTDTDFSFDIGVEGTKADETVETITSITNRDPTQYIAIFSPTETFYQMRYYSGDFSNPIVYNNDQHIRGRDAISTEFIYDRHREYLDPRYGVANISGDYTPIKWVNGYENGSLDLVINTSQHRIWTDELEQRHDEVTVDPNAYYYNQWDIYYGKNQDGTLTNYGFTLRILQNPNGPMYITTVDTSGNTEQILNRVNLGSGWVGASIHIDSRYGNISATPIAPSEWSTFLNWNSAQPEVEIGEIPIGDILGFMVSNDSTYNSFRFQITNTSVFLNTYGVIMIDPYVDILNWYPNNTKFMISFTKTAATGDSITIGGIEYDVEDQMISVPQNNGYVHIDISEYNVTYIQEGDAYKITIESPKSGTSATVTSSDTTISMEGAWYFNSAYYTIEERDYQEYTWQFGELAFGLSALLVFMMIFIGLLTLLTWKLLPGTLGVIDIGIIIVAEVILFIIV